VQWDVAVEIAMLEGGFGFAPIPLGQITPALARCADQVPDDVPVGMHLCYGDAGHQHFQQPESLALQVQVANAVTSAAHRPINWFSFTVPQAQRNSDYFAPLADLRTGPETELYFALVPYYPASQAAGTTAQQVTHIDTHLGKSTAGSRDWGICTECGMGRVEADDVPTLLDLHHTILDTHRDNRLQPARESPDVVLPPHARGNYPGSDTQDKSGLRKITRNLTQASKNCGGCCEQSAPNPLDLMLTERHERKSPRASAPVP
jgi:hypothetical protein